MITNPSSKYSNCSFDVTKKKSKEYYTLLVSTKPQLPSYSANLKRDFNFSENQLVQVYSLPHTVTFEPYIRDFQYKVSNSILYTNAKLFKIGFIEDDKCTFCKQEVEIISQLLFHCFYSKQFWKQFESYFYSITNRQVHLNLRDVLFGIITSKCILFNYLLIIGKLYLRDCRRNKVHPSIHGFQTKVKNKYEREQYICVRDNKM